MSTFKFIGFALLLGLIAWIATSVIAPREFTSVLLPGNAFEGNLQLPKETIEAAFEAARDRMRTVNQRGARLRTSGEFAGWLSFAATSAITLIVGFLGRAPPAPNGPPDTGGLPARAARFVGLFAALAAVLTAGASLSIAKSADYFKHADDLRTLIVQSQKQIIDATNAGDAQAVLDELALQTQR
jgi:amino acid transporter